VDHSPYTISYSYAGDANFTAAGDTSKRLTVLWYAFINVLNLPPPPGKTFKIGSAVPLRWRFTVNGVVYNSVNAHPQVTICAGTYIPPNTCGLGYVYEGDPTDPGSSSFQPPTASNGYTWQFNWQTRNRTSGTYTVWVGSLQTDQKYPGGALAGVPITLK
jgi:hypothetical protein